MSKKRKGRPRTIFNTSPNSANEGLKDGMTRATFLVKEDVLKKIKDIAHLENRFIKDVINEALSDMIKKQETLHNT